MKEKNTNAHPYYWIGYCKRRMNFNVAFDAIPPNKWNIFFHQTTLNVTSIKKRSVRYCTLTFYGYAFNSFHELDLRPDINELSA